MVKDFGAFLDEVDDIGDGAYFIAIGKYTSVEHPRAKGEVWVGREDLFHGVIGSSGKFHGCDYGYLDELVKGVRVIHKDEGYKVVTEEPPKGEFNYVDREGCTLAFRRLPSEMETRFRLLLEKRGSSS